MKVVIDASVAVKWLVDEDRDRLARGVLRDGFVLLAPDLLLTEAANALRNKVRAALIGTMQAREALTHLPNFFDRFSSASELLIDAFEMACRLNHPVADCMYVVCAIQSGAILLTDDQALNQKAKMLGADIKTVLLSDWTPGLQG